jgi:syntaxin 16
MKKYKDLVGEDVKYTNQSIDSKSNFNDNSKSGDFLQVENSNDLWAKRDNEIQNLLRSIEDLAQVFKDLQTLVLEQGTILDRIDCNIEKAVENIDQAGEELEQANKNMKSNCARNSNLFLIVFIFICAILLLFKIF